MTVPVANLLPVCYRACYKGIFYHLSFTNTDIRKAILKKEWEKRPFQSSLGKLRAEWDLATSVEESIELQKQYHIKRIATIIEDELWKHPLLLYNDRITLLDGGHRLWALKYRGEKTADVIIVDKATMNDSEKEPLWKTMDQFAGDARQALGHLGIGIIEQ
jgi:hypothetical protein